MDLITDYIDPTRLTGMIRTALSDLQVNQFTLSRWLPNVNEDDTTFTYVTGGQGLAEASVYRSWDAESPIGRREGISKVIQELPPISEKMVLNEYERLRLRKLSDASLLPFIARDAQRLAKNIGARLELARGDALVNGSITINENGLVQTVSFGRTAGHTVTASTLWSDVDDSNPLDDLEAWVQTYTDTNGIAPGRIVMSRTAWAALRHSEQVRGMVFPANQTVANTPTATGTQVRDALASLDLPEVEIYDASVKVNGSSTRIIAANKVLLLPAPGTGAANQISDLGATVLGTTAESLEPEYGLTGAQPGVVAAQWKTKDPVRVWTHASAVALPVLSTPDLSFAATVL